LTKKRPIESTAYVGVHQSVKNTAFPYQSLLTVKEIKPKEHEQEKKNSVILNVIEWVAKANRGRSQMFVAYRNIEFKHSI
jgi:hypothetical protein